MVIYNCKWCLNETTNRTIKNEKLSISTSLLPTTSRCHRPLSLTARVTGTRHQAPVHLGSKTYRGKELSTEMVMVDEIPFPPQITTTKPLSLLGHGITDIEIHFLQIKFTAIGVYLEPEVVGHLQQWKGKPANVLAEDDDFFEALINAPVEKLLRVVVIKEIKGSQYGVQLESAVRDRLAAVDKYEDEEEEALEKVVEFFQSKYFKKNSIITYHFPANSGTAEIAFTAEGKEDAKIKVENANVVEMIKKWYLGGTRGVSATTITSLANALSAQLCK
ncbi:hypothetical protein PTKIN_Ptkin01aG0261800 [Pterospermum kingtungense]